MKYLIAAHPIQQRILDAVASGKIERTTLRGIGGIVGVSSPQQVKHHLQQMVKYGFLDIVGGKYEVGKLLRKSQEKP
jgi:hypothetical protein